MQEPARCFQVGGITWTQFQIDKLKGFFLICRSVFCQSIRDDIIDGVFLFRLKEMYALDFMFSEEL